MRSANLALAIILAGLCSCSPWGSLDNPADPKSSSYPGYDIVTSANELRSCAPAEGGSLGIPRIAAAKLIGAVAYNLRIASTAEAIDSGWTLATASSSNILDVSGAGLDNGKTYYCRIGASMAAGTPLSWGKVTSFKVDWSAHSTAPRASPGGGSYHVAQPVSLSCDTTGSTIRYSTDGSDPSSASGIAYTTGSSFTIDANCTLRARSYCACMADSPIAETVFTFIPPAPPVVAVEFGACSAALTWDAPEGASIYDLYYKRADSAGPGDYDSAIPAVLPPLTVKGLLAGSTYAFAVVAHGTYGAGEASAVVRGSPLPYSIGSRGPAGGWIFYDAGNYDAGWRFMEAAPSDQGSATWGDDTVVTNVQGWGIGAGYQNTLDIRSVLGAGSYAAAICDSLVLGGYEDWFLPSIGELKAMISRLKDLGLGGFPTSGYYWASNEGEYQKETYASVADLLNLLTASVSVYKAYSNSVRAARRF